jgi:hypothetical protein
VVGDLHARRPRGVEPGHVRLPLDGVPAGAFLRPRRRRVPGRDGRGQHGARRQLRGPRVDLLDADLVGAPALGRHPDAADHGHLRHRRQAAAAHRRVRHPRPGGRLQRRPADDGPLGSRRPRGRPGALGRRAVQRRDRGAPRYGSRRRRLPDHPARRSLPRRRLGHRHRPLPSQDRGPPPLPVAADVGGGAGQPRLPVPRAARDPPPRRGAGGRGRVGGDTGRVLARPPRHGDPADARRHRGVRAGPHRRPRRRRQRSPPSGGRRPRLPVPDLPPAHPARPRLLPLLAPQRQLAGGPGTVSRIRPGRRRRPRAGSGGGRRRGR